MSTEANNPKELSEAIKRGENKIIIKGKFGDRVYAIEAVGPVAWAIAIGGIGVAVTAILVTAGSGGAAAPVAGPAMFVTMPVEIAALGGAGVASTAIAIAVAGGGVGILTSLRKYKAKRDNNGNVILTKR